MRLWKSFAQNKEAVIISGAYLLVGILWILFSDRLLLAGINDPGRISSYQTLNRWIIRFSIQLSFIRTYQRITF